MTQSGTKSGKQPRETTAALRAQLVPYLQMGWKYERIAKLFRRAPSTIAKWAGHPDVKRALQELSEHVEKETREKAADLASKAWDTLEELMDGAADERVRLDAAKTVLSRKGAPEQTKTEATVEQTGGPQVVVQMAPAEVKRLAKGAKR